MVRKVMAGSEKSGIGRRRFLAGGCAAAAGLWAAPGAGRSAGPVGKLRLKVVYALHAMVQPKPDWPNLGFDFAPVIERINAALAQAFPEVEFLPVTATGPRAAERILLEDAFSDIDGYIVYHMNAWKVVAPVLATARKPLLLADFNYAGSGGFLAFAALFTRTRNRRVGFVSSSDLDDLVAAVKCFERVKTGATSDFAAATAQVRRERTPAAGDLSVAPDPVSALDPEECLRELKGSKILAVGPNALTPAVSYMGVPVKRVSFAELTAAWQAADRDRAGEVAQGWQRGAEAVEGVFFETLADSAAMYVGMKDLLQRHGADAITVNCLAGFYAGKIPAYPCLGFHELCNEGLVGACECDVRSTATMLMVKALTRGRPGYISDPVIDTSQRRIIYAHCVASNRPFGPAGPRNPYQILTHSEDRKGASVRSLLPAGYLTTTVEFDPRRREVLFHQAKTVGNDPEDRACRTKLVAEPVGDMEKLFTMWDRWGWHRVTVYGDLKEPVAALAEAMGYQVVTEA